jgi:hypothetical protein
VAPHTHIERRPRGDNFLFLFEFSDIYLSLTTSMASLLTNVFRAQVRIALVASRARVAPSTATFFSLASRQSISSFCARSLSTSQIIRQDYDGGRLRNPPNNTLFVGNLPYSVGEEELRELMSGFGDISAVRMGLFFFSFYFLLYHFSFSFSRPC